MPQSSEEVGHREVSHAYQVAFDENVDRFIAT